MSFTDNLHKVLRRHDELRDMLSAGTLAAEAFTKAAREYAELTPVAEAVTALRSLEKELAELSTMIESETDVDMRRMANAEYEDKKAQLPTLTRQVQLLLLPKDSADERNVILEIRAGAGGDEAALFARELFDMYQRYAGQQGWRFDIIELSENDIGGMREGSAEITGRGVFARLKFESGVHRVQRVPTTETQGRVHTSTVTVAIMPEAEEVDIRIDDKDLRIDVMRAQGAGGQHVNKTESAVRITHLPTNTVVFCQDGRSQLANKDKAMKVLRARLYEAERQRLADVRAADRKSQVGTGDRSERIRTYNFPQSRVTDHRINHTSHNIEGVMDGRALDEFIDHLLSQDEAERLAAAGMA